jgi:voltage-gated potassium channel
MDLRDASGRLEEIRLRGAILLIVTVAALFSLFAAILERLIDPEFDNIGIALWWAVTTVTTVGYGDVIPETAQGKAVASVLMLIGIALIPTLTSVVVSGLISQRSRRDREVVEQEITRLVELMGRVEGRLAKLEHDGR